MIGKFFHTPKPHQFNIPYRYYDPAKEEMKQREERIKAELGISESKSWDSGQRINLRGSFRNAMRVSSKTASEDRSKSTTRLILLMIILSLIAYFVFK